MKAGPVNLDVRVRFPKDPKRPDGEWFDGRFVVRRDKVEALERDGMRYERPYTDDGRLVGAFFPSREENPRAVPKMADWKQVERWLQSNGWTIERTGGNHLRITSPGGCRFTTSATASDHRAIRNVVADIRRCARADEVAGR